MSNSLMILHQRIDCLIGKNCDCRANDNSCNETSRGTDSRYSKATCGTCDSTSSNGQHRQ